MNESRLSTIEQIEQFLSASSQVEFSAHAGDAERYEHISRVLGRRQLSWRHALTHQICYQR